MISNFKEGVDNSCFTEHRQRQTETRTEETHATKYNNEWFGGVVKRLTGNKAHRKELKWQSEKSTNKS